MALHVFYPEEAWQTARWQATWPPLATGAAAMLLVAVAAYAIAQRVTQPIRELKSHVARIADGEFTAMATPTRDDEVRDLALAVNQMAEKLAEYESKTREQERLSTLGTLGGGIAHQIRNAATGCRLALDLHQRDCPLADSNDNGQQPLAVAARQLALIETHIQRFLTLGRPTPARRDEVDLAAVILEALSLVEPMAQHLGSPLQFEPPAEALVVLADRQSLEQMLVNLLVNAVQASAQALTLVGGPYSTSSPAVQVKLWTPDLARARICIVDCGPGPTPAMTRRMFEPFATDKPGGTGLGLVVARRIAEDHGGTIGWTRRDERTWFTIELPLIAKGKH
jgi:signal transduction histidine kinase